MMKLNGVKSIFRKTLKTRLLIIHLTLTTFSAVMLKLIKNINNIQNVFPRDKITIAFRVFYKVLLVFMFCFYWFETNHWKLFWE